MAAVCSNLVIPHRQDDHIDISLRAAERARNASEVFIQKVNELIPEDPKKYHRDLLKGIDSKLALLKKNVAYLVIQNLTLIDKLMDAENTVQQVRNLHEMRNNWKDRPNTFAAPDTPTEHHHSDRTKCESWCNPSLDFMFFNDNSTDLQSRKLSLTNNFITNRLRHYIIREDMVNYLQPHLAAYLYPNHFSDKDSDNDSGTGEEIASPDETLCYDFENSKFPGDFETSKFADKFETSKFSANFETVGDLDGISSVIANGNFSVKCSRGIIAEKFGEQIRISTDIGFVQSIELGGGEMECDFNRQKASIPDKISGSDIGNLDTMSQTSRNKQPCNTSLSDEFKRRGNAAIGSCFADSQRRDGGMNIKQDVFQSKTYSRINSNTNVESITEVRRTSIRNNSYVERNTETNKRDNSYVEQNTEANKKDNNSYVERNTEANKERDIPKPSQRPSTVRDTFAKEVVTAYSTTNNEVKSETKTTNNEAKGTETRGRDYGSSLYKNENKVAQIKLKDEVNNTMPTVNDNANDRVNADCMIQKRKQLERADKTIKQGNEKPLHGLHKSASLNFEPGLSFLPPRLARGSSTTRCNEPGLKEKSIGIHRAASTESSKENDDDGGKYIILGDNISRRQQHQYASNLELSDRQRNFSSKVNRGNKLRKSKRIEETQQKMFQQKGKEMEGKQKPDPTLRRLESINRVTGTMKVSDKILKRLQNSQGDLSGP